MPGFRSTDALTVVPGLRGRRLASVSVCASGSSGGTSIWRLWVSRPMLRATSSTLPEGTETSCGVIAYSSSVTRDDGLVLADRVVVGAPRREHDRGREEGAEEGAPGGELRRRHHL